MTLTEMIANFKKRIAEDPELQKRIAELKEKAAEAKLAENEEK